MKPHRFHLQRYSSIRQWAIVILPALLFATFAFVLLFMRSMKTDYNHDENQFIASAYLLAREGLLPYRDYPYFHMPNLVLVYAMLFQQVSTYLFWTRVFSVLCATAIISLVWITAMVIFRHRSLVFRLTIAAGAGLLLLGNQIFNYGSALAWNHASSGLLLVLAVLIFLYGVHQSTILRWIFLAGLLLGAAAGVRLSLVTSAVAFGLAVWIDPKRLQMQLSSSLRRLGALLAGFLVGILPAILLFFAAPNRFIFGNLTYARLNTQFRLETEYSRAMSLGGKLEVILNREFNQPTNLLLLLLSILFIYLAGWLWMKARAQLDFTLLFSMTLVLLTGLGALLPTPFFTQYLFVVVPVAVLGVLFVLSKLVLAKDDELVVPIFVSIFLLVVGFTALFGFRDLSLLRQIEQIHRWYPIQVRTLGTDIRSLADHGKILTLAPIFPIEAELQIYPELATGPFAWRTAPLLTPAERQRYQMIGPAELEQLLAGEPPAAVLTGANPALEQALVDYARGHNYEYHPLNDDLSLWVNPAP